MKRIATLPAQQAAPAKLAFVGLQQRLLSSVAAFTRTLHVHRNSLQKLLDHENVSTEAAGAFTVNATSEVSAQLGLEDEDAEKALDADEEASTEAATAAGSEGAASARSP